MNREVRKDLCEEITLSKIELFKTQLKMSKRYLYAYFNSMYAFGNNNEVANRVRKLWENFYQNINEERLLLKLLKKYLSSIEPIYSYSLIDILDSINSELVEHCQDVLDDVDDACFLKEIWRIGRYHEFEKLINDDKYRKFLCYHSLDMIDIMTFMKLPISFWQYIQPRTLRILCDTNYDDIEPFFGINMKFDKEQKLNDILMVVPAITSLKMALINIYELQIAYNLYQCLGKTVNEDLISEAEADKIQKQFIKQYVPIKYKKMFKE